MENLKLGIDWDVNQAQLSSDMDKSQKSIEGAGQTIEAVEKKVNDNLSNLTKATQERIESLRARIAQIQSDIAKWSSPDSTLGLSENDSYFDKYREKIVALKAEIESLQNAPLLPNDAENLPEQAGKVVDALAGSSDKAKDSTETATDALEDLLTKFISWNAIVEIGKDLLVTYGPVLLKFAIAAIKGKDAVEELRREMEELRAVRLKGAQDAQRELSSLDSLYRATQNQSLAVSERKKAVDALQSQYPQYFKSMSDEQVMAGKAADSYSRLKDAIISAARARAYQDKIAELARKRLENEDKIVDLAASSEEANTNYKKEKSKLDATDSYGNVQGYNIALGKASTAQTAVEVIKNDITELNEANSVLDRQMKRYQTTIDGLVKVDGVGILLGNGGKDDPKPKSAENALESILDSRKSALQKMDELKRDFARKGMQSDEEEIQAVRDKFTKINEIIATENEKIDRYNIKNKDKKGFKPVEKIDTSQLKPIEEQAVQEVIYKQGTDKISKDIEAKKKLFADYEDYRTKLGKKKADERFKDELNGFENLADYLKAKSASNQEAIDSVRNKTADAGQQERANLLEKETKEAVSAEQKKQTDVLALMISYDQQRKNLIEGYETERAKLIATSTAEELAEFDRRHAEELNQLDDSNIQKLQSVKSLFDGIERLTDSQARAVIKNVEAMLATGINISPDLLKKIREALKDATKSLDERLPDRVMQVANSFTQMAQEIGQVNTGLGNMLAGVGNILSASVQIGTNFSALTKGLENYEKFKAAKDQGKVGGGATGLLGSISAIAGVAGPVGGIVSAVAGVASGVVKFFGAAKESARQAEKQLREYQQKIIEGELEYGRLIRERARSQKSVNDMTLNELNLQKELLKTQLETEKLRDISYDKKVKRKIPSLGITVDATERVNEQKVLSDYEYALEKILREGSEVTGMKKEKYGGILGIGKKTRLVEVTASLAGKTYEDLEKLYTEGKMNEATKALFENLKKAKEEVDDINELMKQIDEQIMDKMSGSVSASGISSSIIQGFKDGKRAVIDFASDAEEVIQNALLSAMSATVLEEPLQELVKSFREDAKDGLSESEIEEFKKAYGDVVQSGIDAMKEIDKLTGGKIGSSSPTGRINASISETTGSSILGFERSRYEIAKQQLQAVLSALDFEKKSYEQRIEAVRYLKAIEQNTRDTVTELKNVVVELKSINKNTTSKTGRTTEGMGL